ncbi:glutamate/gamma-aminobutyrate family transporter YjeM [Clostridium fermenticellae]|uniref:Glutamate/gamma-aminobutyrate family transporter YjeM n=1 Tax=Clostridium fermenticellae TaxID=2068654 RepID=A0A386H5Q5_9CLOT|nr:glutamate/gamma-aminobutyrate family transporter YjeM [Clostridium fermenticellae]AYD40873.1 glutamate/gamma-aminobutyrate family transporter YjeM [Clostridium fermenticellae]
MGASEQKKMTLVALILMIFTSVFGFNNIPRAFYLMGYGAIPWYILSAAAFFIPYAFMMSEYGAAFKDEKGGIYSWMENSVGPKYAFIGTFMWYASYVIWMVNISSTIWVPLSNAIFGSDRTSTWAFLGLNSTQVLGILGICWILIVTIVGSKGLQKITKITSVGGTAVALLNVVLLIGAIVVLIANGGHLAQPVVSAATFVQSPNPNYQSSISILSFLVYALFAYGGIEAVGGLVDQTENAEVTFPKGVTIAAIIITVGYCVGIFLCGIFTNWNDVLSAKNVNLANIGYITMQNLGYQIGQGFGLSEATSLTIGAWVSRYTGLSMFLALTGAFFTLSYSPLKQLIEGTPKKLWPGKMAELKDGMPKNAMWVQCAFVVGFIALVSFGGDAAAKFFAILVNMTNVAMTLPYMFLSISFIYFKKKTSINKPFEVYKNHSWVVIVTAIVTFIIGFANFFTIIEPAVRGDLKDTIWMIVGPVLFSIIALLIYSSYEKRTKGEV